jgi:hypothetical protein
VAIYRRSPRSGYRQTGRTIRIAIPKGRKPARCHRPARHAGRTGRASRRQTLEQIFRTAREHLQDLNWTLGPGRVVAAAAVVAAGLPAGGAFARAITGHDYEVAALVIPGDDPELAGAALAALLVAGRDGPWHQGWADDGTALQARRTTDQLASVF